MKSCFGCKFARWDLNKAGKLHPSGDGLCTYKVKIPKLPASMSWYLIDEPRTTGGTINRKKLYEHHCGHYQAT